jgi:hypothetical protein
MTLMVTGSLDTVSLDASVASVLSAAFAHAENNIPKASKHEIAM